MTNWKVELDKELRRNGESWADVEANTMTDEEMEKDFDSGGGCSFTVWTSKTVYFSRVYDDEDFIDCVARNPTKHQGD